MTNTYYPYNDKIKRIEIELPNKNRKLVAQYDYDEIGRLSSINRGQNIDCAHFKYNTRGSVTQILSDSFCENLYYTDSNLSVPCFNGNISCMTWQTSNDNVLRGYAFSYDNLNRLTTSMYGEEESLQSNKNHYSEIIQEYDANSTPLALKRYGKKNDGTYGLIDDLQLNIKVIRSYPFPITQNAYYILELSTLSKILTRITSTMSMEQLLLTRTRV